MAKYLICLAFVVVGCGGSGETPPEQQPQEDKYGECLQTCVNDPNQNPADCQEVCAHAVPSNPQPSTVSTRN